MSSSNNRFGRRTGRQNDDLRAEPVLSFNPKRPAARDAQSPSEPAIARKPQAGPRVDREDAEEFGVSFGRDGGRGPRIERDKDFDPRVRPEKALDRRVPESERPLYHHLFDEQENRRRGFGWIAALGSVAVVAIGAAYAWHNFMARSAPAGLYEPPGFTTRNNGTGYMTPTQPTDAGAGSDTGAAPSTLATTPPASPAQQPTRDVAAAPAPKSVPVEAPPPPKKTISEMAANPGSLGPPVANPAPTPPAAKQPVVAPAPILTPPPKHDAAKPETPKRDALRKDASITPPKPAPAPAPQDSSPPALTQPAAAPAVTAPPPRQFAPRAPNSQAPGAQATGQPQPLTGNAPAAYAPPSQPQAPQQLSQPGNAAGPQPNGPDTVTVDGVTYINGQEPHALGTLAGPPQAANSDASLPATPVQSAPPGYSTRSFAPADRDGGAPLPNDVIILPNGQMAVPNGQQ